MSKLPRKEMKSTATSTENVGVWHPSAFSPPVLDQRLAIVHSLGYTYTIKTTKKPFSPKGNCIELCNDYQVVSKTYQ